MAISQGRATEELKRAEDELRRSEQKYRTIFENTGTATALIGGDGTILTINSEFEKLSGYSKQEVEGKKTVLEFATKEDADKLIKYHLLGRAHPGNTHRKYETRFVARDGVIKDIAVTVDMIPGTDMSVRSAVDITEAKKINQYKDEFASFVAHEVRNPLTIIMGAVNTVLKEGPHLSAEDMRELLVDAASETDVLAELIDNLLELSRAQANRLNLKYEPVNIEQLSKEQIDRVRMQPLHAARQFIADFPEKLPPVEGDRVRLERVLYNLIENAAKYSPGGGEIRVFARKEENGLLVGVKDHGIGISPENQAKLFQPFERLGQLPEGQIKGTGIGLVVCRRLVEAHSGRIWVEAEPGKGSTFFFTLPFHK